MVGASVESRSAQETKEGAAMKPEGVAGAAPVANTTKGGVTRVNFPVPPGAPGPFVQRLNAWAQLPVVVDVLDFLSGAMVLLMAPLLLPMHVLLFLWDMFTGYVWDPRGPLSAEGRAVLITGCDTGFGQWLAIRMAQLGWRVYAGCLTEQGRNTLSTVSPSLLTPLELDVTKPEHVEAVMARIDAENPQGLYCLVNNAGVGSGCLADWQTMDDYRRIFEVNFFAFVNMHKSALPLLKRSARNGQRPRILDLTSFSTRVHGRVMMSGYASSKCAAEAFAKAFREELVPFGISLSIYNPGYTATPMVNGMFDSIVRAFERAPKEKQEEYGREYLEEVVEIARKSSSVIFEPEPVMGTLVHGVTSRTPRRNYVVGLDARFLILTLMHIPERFLVPAVARLEGTDKLRPSVLRNAAATGNM